MGDQILILNTYTNVKSDLLSDLLTKQDDVEYNGVKYTIYEVKSNGINTIKNKYEGKTLSYNEFQKLSKKIETPSEEGASEAQPVEPAAQPEEKPEEVQSKKQPNSSESKPETKTILSPDLLAEIRKSKKLRPIEKQQKKQNKPENKGKESTSLEKTLMTSPVINQYVKQGRQAHEEASKGIQKKFKLLKNESNNNESNNNQSEGGGKSDIEQLIGRYIYYFSNKDISTLSNKERYKLIKIRPYILKHIKDIVPTIKMNINLKNKKYIIVTKKMLNNFKKQLNSL